MLAMHQFMFWTNRKSTEVKKDTQWISTNFTLYQVMLVAADQRKDIIWTLPQFTGQQSLNLDWVT